MDFNKIKEMGLEYAEKGKNAALDLAEKGRTQAKIVNAQGKLYKAQRQLGALVYSLAKGNEENQPLVDKYIEMIANIEQELADLKASLEPDTIIETTFEEKDEADDDVTEDAPAAPAEEKPEAEKEAPKPINDTQPLYARAPQDCTDEDYKQFYRKVFHEYEDPLFWIHLNVDYPFKLKGILYFPKIKEQFGGIEGQIKLYSGQVFVADNIKEVIPEFLMLLKGVIDCADFPLNVSRSFLQNDGYVRRISNHITKKVADRLTGMFKTERETYEGFWPDIHPFIKYGVMRDEKFAERMKDCLLFKTTDGKFLTLAEYKERNGE